MRKGGTWLKHKGTIKKIVASQTDTFKESNYYINNKLVQTEWNVFRMLIACLLQLSGDVL